MVTAFIQRGAPLKELTVLQISNVKDGQPKLYICADEREGRRKGRERKGREGKGREKPCERAYGHKNNDINRMNKVCFASHPK